MDEVFKRLLKRAEDLAPVGTGGEVAAKLALAVAIVVAAEVIGSGLHSIAAKMRY